jgi:ubiquinone/menaquinone biosynthesis C-methylase UbiE/uncharacterized protein YbaR (Trm112 family)
MHTTLLAVLCCPFCHGPLDAEGGPAADLLDGGLICLACGRRFAVENGMPILGDRDSMAKVCDTWTEGMLTPELFRRNIQASRVWYGQSDKFARFVDAAAQVEGLIVDIATGPGASFSGALAPRLSERAHFVMTDAAADMLQGLKSAWAEESHAARVDFTACDGHRLPFRDRSLDALTSAGGFDCVNDDPARSRPPGAGRAYQEAHRVLKPGGQVFHEGRLYAHGSKTAEYLASLGCANASVESLESHLGAVGFDIVSKVELHKAKGKTSPGDGLPIDESDEWYVMAWVLRKG